MKAKLTIFFYVALLPSVIYGYRGIRDYIYIVEDIARVGGRIEGIFQPEGDKSLGKGGYGFAYAGTLFPSERKIAMKFTLSEDICDAKREYEMYTYLDAIDNPNVEQYGIPSVYYFGKWNEHSLIMMGISLLGQSIYDLENSRKLRDDVNILIIIRDFIFTSKYMHSRAVRHDHISQDNMVVRGNRLFLIDFGGSSKMNERSLTGCNDFKSKRAHTNGERYPKDDWESFVYSISYSLDALFDWIGLRFPKATYNMKSNTTAVKDRIKSSITSKRLRKIVIKLAKHVHDDGGEGAKEAPFYSASNSKRFPDYNRFYKLVNDEIEKLNLPSPAMFTWLSPEPTSETVDDSNEHPIPDITTISDPRDYDFSSMKYPDVDFNKFSSDFYEDENASSSQECFAIRTLTRSNVCIHESSIESKTSSSSSVARNSIHRNKSKKKYKPDMFGCLPCRSSKDKAADYDGNISP